MARHDDVARVPGLHHERDGRGGEQPAVRLGDLALEPRLSFRIRPKSRGDSSALGLGKDAEPLLRDPTDRAGIEIGRDHGQAITESKLEQGLVHREVGPAALAPAQPGIEGGGAVGTAHGLVHLWLLILGEHLEGQRGAGAGPEHCLEHARLMGMVHRVVVGFPEIDDAREARARGDKAPRALGVAVLGEDEATGGGRAPAQSERGGQAGERRAPSSSAAARARRGHGDGEGHRAADGALLGTPLPPHPAAPVARARRRAARTPPRDRA